MDVPGFALVTGAASGIGKACATAFAADGAAGVALLDVNHDALAAVKAHIDERQSGRGGNPCRVETYTVDVTDIAMKHEGGAAFAQTGDWKSVLGLTRTASEDYAKDGLRINAICPGYTKTPMTTKSPLVLKAMEERVGTAVPMGRMGRPEEIADGVVCLAGGRSSFVTGTALFVDGGYTQR